MLVLSMYLLRQVPQQPNAVDCGFYVMAFIRYLIAGILQNGAGKTWVSGLHFCLLEEHVGSSVVMLTSLLVCSSQNSGLDMKMCAHLGWSYTHGA